jgi:hypothetical protein
MSDMAIVKVLARHNPSYASLANYVMRYMLHDDKADKSRVYTQNLRSDTVAGYVREFINNESFRKFPRRDMIYLTHEILSFHRQQDNAIITPKILDDLISEYMRLRGEKGIILAAPHFDKDHIHVHFAISALEFRTGKSFGMNKAQLHELKISFQRYHTERYPEIGLSTPHHGKGERNLSHAEWHRKEREKIMDTVKKCYSAAQSQQHFLDLLRAEGLHHYERNGKPTGIEHDGLKFRFSRMLEEKQFESLGVDRTEEEKALAELQSIRDRQQGLDRDNRDEWEVAR